MNKKTNKQKGRKRKKIVKSKKKKPSNWCDYFFLYWMLKKKSQNNRFVIICPSFFFPNRTTFFPSFFLQSPNEVLLMNLFSLAVKKTLRMTNYFQNTIYSSFRSIRDVKFKKCNFISICLIIFLICFNFTKLYSIYNTNFVKFLKIF